MRWRMVGAVLAVSLLFGDVATAADRRVALSFALFSDIYEIGERDGRGGFARVASAIKAERRRNPNTIVAHAGDTFSPSLRSGLDKGRAIVALMNVTGIDLFVPGNHEFDFGETVFRERLSELTVPVLAANLSDADGKPLPGIADTRMLEVDGVKVGVIGLTDDSSAMRSSPGSLRFAPSMPMGENKARELRAAGADIVVLVVHAPWQDDLRLVNSGLYDVVLSGHDHDLMLLYDGRSVLAEAKEEGETLVVVDLDITVSDGDPRKIAWHPRFRIVDTADVSPDPEIAAQVATYEDELDADLAAELGKTATPLDSRKSTVRGGEAALGNLITDAMREAVGADVAIMNGGGIRGDKQYEAGQVLTKRDVLTELPFGNKLVVLEVLGSDLRTALENGVWFADKAEGRFAQLSGARIVARRNAVPGKRLTEIEVGGLPLDPGKRYKLAVNDFLATGKDGYDVLLKATVLLEANEGPLVATVVMDAIKTAGAVTPRIEGRIRFE
ncbi:MAG: 5'-nucleotidase C-terminal domain-containing protein [Hyphomicrobiaceae bacterium]